MSGVGGEPQETLGERDRGKGVSQSKDLECSRAREDADLGERGDRLRRSLVARDPELAKPDNPMAEVMLSACRAADRVELLEERAAGVEPWVTNDKGTLISHPVLVEVRQHAALLARLVTGLRLPDAKTGKRPQSRPMRGMHAPYVPEWRSSLEKARQRAEEVNP